MRLKTGSFRLISALALLIGGLAAQDAAAACHGRDLFTAMPVSDRAALQAEAAAVPHSQGLIWRAERGDARMVVVGTYHLDDPRHDALAARLAPELADAALLLVEAGPDEQEALKSALAADPSLYLDAEGPTLIARLGAAEWDRLRAAMAARNIPAAIASRMRPWYASLMLGIAPCVLEGMAEGGIAGLDQRLMAQAEDAGIPVRALEPWDTLFSIFADLAPDDEIELIRTALAGADLADDMVATMADAYFAGRGWKIWLLQRHLAEAAGLQSPSELAEQFALTQEVLLTRRNRAWLGLMREAAEAAARDGKPVVIAVGLLHLPGEAGVLALLEGEGWRVEALTY